MTTQLFGPVNFIRKHAPFPSAECSLKTSLGLVPPNGGTPCSPELDGFLNKIYRPKELRNQY